MKTTTQTTEARIFLTDYASYNNGTQFEFGHWVDLSDFSSAEELNEYIENHFAEADEKSPLLGGCKREEIMITDFEGFPEDLYSESMNFDDLFEYLNLDDDNKVKVAFIIEQGESFDYAMSKFEDVCLYEDTQDTIYMLFEEFYPEAEKSSCTCDYLTIDYDRFKKAEFTEFQFDGVDYIVLDNWNN
jgi:hypothetical protein